MVRAMLCDSDILVLLFELIVMIVVFFILALSESSAFSGFSSKNVSQPRYYILRSFCVSAGTLTQNKFVGHDAWFSTFRSDVLPKNIAVSPVASLIGERREHSFQSRPRGDLFNRV